MIEIKFRVFDVDSSEMLFTDSDNNYRDWFFEFQGGFLKLFTPEEDDFAEEREAVFMQYTGFEDAGGIELYVDDIIEEDGKFYIIEWDESMGMFQCTNIHSLDNIALHEFDGVNTVWHQGNKHENPELLTT